MWRSTGMTIPHNRSQRATVCDDGDDEIAGHRARRRVRLAQSDLRKRAEMIAYDHRKLSPANGSVRIRLPVAAKIALHTAGAAAGRPGSPKPVGGADDFMKCTSTTGGD